MKSATETRKLQAQVGRRMWASTLSLIDGGKIGLLIAALHDKGYTTEWLRHPSVDYLHPLRVSW